MKKKMQVIVLLFCGVNFLQGARPAEGSFARVPSIRVTSVGNHSSVSPQVQAAVHAQHAARPAALQLPHTPPPSHPASPSPTGRSTTPESGISGTPRTPTPTPTSAGPKGLISRPPDLVTAIQKGDSSAAQTALEKRPGGFGTPGIVTIANAADVVVAATHPTTGDTVLHQAAVKGETPEVTLGRTNIATFLTTRSTDASIKNSVDINSKNTAGETPMVVAVKTGNLRFVQEFLSTADLTAKDSTGRTLVSIAADSLKDAATHYDPKNKDSVKAFETVATENLQIMKALLPRLDGTNAVDTNGRSALLAVVEMLDPLIKKGTGLGKSFVGDGVDLFRAMADKIATIQVTVGGKTMNLIDAPGADKQSPLDRATNSTLTQSGDIKFVTLVLSKGASADNDSGRKLLSQQLNLIDTKHTMPDATFNFIALLRDQGVTLKGETPEIKNMRGILYRWNTSTGVKYPYQIKLLDLFKADLTPTKPGITTIPTSDGTFTPHPDLQNTVLDWANTLLDAWRTLFH